MFGKNKDKDKPKRKFTDTKLGQFAKKVSKEIPSIAGDILEVATSSNPLSATFNIIKDRLQGVVNDPSGINSNIAKELLNELELRRMDFEAEIYELEIKDRDSARNREIEIAKAGKNDFMQILTGIIGLSIFVYLVYQVINTPSLKDNPLAIHIIGLVEGVVLSIFYYYYGTSKGSKDKDSDIRSLK